MARRSKVQYGCKVTSDMLINDEATTMAGFDISGSMAFCVKRSIKENKCDIYKLDGFETASAPSNKKTIPVKGYGMTYFAQNLYITTDNNKVVRVPYAAGDVTTDFFKVVTMDGKELNSTAITARAKNEFILMANYFNEGEYLCFSECTLNSAAMELKEHRRFYVKNSGFSEVKDIYYDTKYGLFIVTNKEAQNGIANSSLILRVDTKRLEVNGHKNCDLCYPVNRYYLVANDAFTKFTIESVSIASKGEQIGKMYAIANVSKPDGKNYDRMLHFNNFTFNADKPFSVLTQSYTTVDIPYIKEAGKTYECKNPGAFALEGEIGYCLVTDSANEEAEYDDANKASVLLSSPDINSSRFERLFPKEKGVYTNMGHGNGMTYYDGALYVAAYIREELDKGIEALRHIVKLSTNGEVLGVYEIDEGSYIGSISHYNGNLFILGEYDALGKTSYALKPTFYIGYFENNKFVKTNIFSVTNPTFTLEPPAPNKSAKNVLQDIHYDHEFGLYYVTYTNGKSHMYRVCPEKIENVVPNWLEPELLEPDEQFEFESAFSEVESLSISNLEGKVGTMYIAAHDRELGNYAHRVTAFKFYRSDLA